MKNRFFALILISSLFMLMPALSHAVKTTYIATNHRYNSVLVKEVSSKLAKEREMTHPVQLDKTTLRNILGAITIAKKNFGSKKVNIIHVFDGPALDFMTENIQKAFAQATPFEEVHFSYLSKNPLIFIKNDRLSLGKAWIHGNELHIQFNKLWAKVTMDTDKRGNEARAMQSAKGVRTKLNSGPGIRAVNDEYIIADLTGNIEAPGEDVEIDDPTAEEAPLPEKSETASPPTVTDNSKKHAKKSATQSAASVEPASSNAKPTAEERLETLKKLKDKGFISDKEYLDKRQEILKGL